jgi:hypothetical protein
MFHGKEYYRILFMLALVVGILFARELMSQSSVEEAKLHYKQGVALFKEENYKMALAEFLKSNELNPNWKLKLNIGICYFNLNRFVQAQDVITEYIEEGGDQLEDAKRDQAEELLEKISKLLAQVKVDTNVEGATVFLDDKEVATTPMSKPIVLESGLYKIRIEAEGYKPYVKDISVAGGDQKVLDVSLVKKKSAAVTEEEGKGEETGTGTGGGKVDTGGEKKKKKLSGLAIAAIALAPVALGAFGGVAGAGIKHNNLKSEFEDEGCDSHDPQTTSSGYDCKGAYDEIFMLENVTNAMIAVGAVLAAASLALGITDVVLQKKKKKQAAFMPRLQAFGLSPAAGDSPGAVLTFSGQW